MNKLIQNSCLQVGILFCFLASTVLAEQNQVLHSQSVVPVDRWQISVSVGIGKKSNPLFDGDDLPLLIIPSVYYYGERFYFDNGDIGYSFYEDNHFSLTAVARLNEEYAHFIDGHPANFLVATTVGVSVAPETEVPLDAVPAVPSTGDGMTDDGGDPQPSQPQQPSFGPDQREVKFHRQNLADKKWSVDAGLQFYYFVNQQNRLRLRYLTDVSSVHSGSNVNIEYSYLWQQNNWAVRNSIGADWLSSEVSQYYYGIGQRDTQQQQYWYHPSASWLPYLRINPNYKINDAWKAVFLLEYQSLSKALKNSPVVEDNARTTLFFGVNYAF
ncbi:MipA/OmpV family protein [Catenovulum sediminis]|uniref:MipA/OmpV family protein n=1 Tax=Catenovulum sediminis TaxID=1740262 RepID=A0ABV1RET7_9ALTE